MVPPLADYLNRHPSASSFFENVVPIILVAGLTIAVCPLLLLVANKAETLICGYQVHNSVMWRNWIFLEINVVIFFAIGKGVIQSYIFSKFSAQNVLSDVASAFPAAAPYYASYLLLQTVIQSFFELFRLGVSDRKHMCHSFFFNYLIDFLPSSCRFSFISFRPRERSLLARGLSGWLTLLSLGSFRSPIRSWQWELLTCLPYTTPWFSRSPSSTIRSRSVSCPRMIGQLSPTNLAVISVNYKRSMRKSFS